MHSQPTYRMIRRPPLCEGAHRSGWPFVLSHLAAYDADDSRTDLPVLDDFVEATFGWQRRQLPQCSSWVGVFHHPSEIASPLSSDCVNRVDMINHDRAFRRAKGKLIGVVCLAPGPRDVLSQLLKRPVLLAHHPTDLNVKPWSRREAQSQKTLFQNGLYLRNTRFVYQCSLPAGWVAQRSALHTGWSKRRDVRLHKAYTKPSSKHYREELRGNDHVKTLDFMTPDDYDTIMSRCVCVTEIHGAAANNVVIECMARGTPLIVNRTPDVEFYLGQDYPLYMESPSHVAPLLGDWDALSEASTMMKNRRHLLDVSQFVASVAAFVKTCSEDRRKERHDVVTTGADR